MSPGCISWPGLSWAAGVCNSSGAAYTLAGRTDEAVAHLEEAAVAGEAPNTLDPFTLVLLGYAYLSAERLADASRCAHQALIGCHQQTRRNVEAHALHLVGAFASRQEPLVLEDAMQRYRQALALAGELGMCPLAAHCHLSLGKLYHKTGQTGQAREHLTTATTMYREMLMTYWLEKSETGVKELE
jgi:tetratricopeptide (TPR) repeat protein